MVTYTRCLYTIPKDRTSYFLSLINIYHPKGEITVNINSNNVYFIVISDTVNDFYNLLPSKESYSYSPSNKLTHNQSKAKEQIEHLFFGRLRYKSREIPLHCNYEALSFNQLLDLVLRLKYTSCLYPIEKENIIYVGIGSEKLGYYIMILTPNKAFDAIVPKLDLDLGFKDDAYPYSELNRVFNIWKNNNYIGDMLLPESHSYTHTQSYDT